MKTPSSRRSSDDRLFRLGTGFFALIVVLLVAGIGLELFRNSRLSIAKFGLNFWRTKTWDPVAGNFGALPFLWGTLYSSFLALLISTPIALGIAIFLSELSPERAPHAAGVPDGAARGDPVDRVRPLGHLRSGSGGARASRTCCRQLAAQDAAVFRSARRGRDARGRADPRRHGHSVHVVRGARGAAGRSRDAARGGLRARRDALGGDPGGRPIRAHGHHRRRDPRASAARSARRWPSRWSSATTRRSPLSLFAPQYTMAAVIANEFTEAADDLYLNALIEIGLVLFVVTLIINAHLAPAHLEREPAGQGRGGRGRAVSRRRRRRRDAGRPASRCSRMPSCSSAGQRSSSRSCRSR